MEENLITNICRACLTEEGEFQSVFVGNEKSGSIIHLAEMMMSYASVQITLGDGLPETICLPCVEKVVDMYLFKRRCEDSDTVLREQLGKSPLHNMCSITEEQQLAEEVLDIDSYSIDIIIKPEINREPEHFQEAEEHSIVAEEQDNEVDVDNDFVPSRHRNLKKKVYECNICFKVFKHANYLNCHKKTHNTPKFICDICNKVFTENDAFLHHQLSHEIKREEQFSPYDSTLKQDLMDNELVLIKSEELYEDLSCAICNKSFLNKDDYSAHTLTDEHKAKNLSGAVKCTQCNKKFTKVAHLTRHLKIHAEVKPHICLLCEKGFARAEQLVNHMNAHSGIKPHVCNICNKGFNQVSNLKDHMRTHNGDKPFLCSICGKGFNQLGNLRQHTVRHSGIKAHLCSTCGNGFASKGELCAHLRKHTGARPFVCQVCNNGFTTSSSLTKHKRIHSGEKPYECEVCKMKFSRSGILARHKRTHTGEKPYVCKFCTKAFSQSNDLSSHLRIHTGEKPYICDTCGQAFRQSSALKTHKKTHMDRSTIIEIQHARNIVPLIHNTYVNAVP